MLGPNAPGCTSWPHGEQIAVAGPTTVTLDTRFEQTGQQRPLSADSSIVSLQRGRLLGRLLEAIAKHLLALFELSGF